MNVEEMFVAGGTSESEGMLGTIMSEDGPVLFVAISRSFVLLKIARIECRIFGDRCNSSKASSG